MRMFDVLSQVVSKKVNDLEDAYSTAAQKQTQQPAKVS
jgi:hypothetical protein